jgi:CRISPR/Cas system CSM-associated protein Csm2 small subunit
MDQETLHELVDIKILISTKQRFTNLEQIKIYNLYNKITGENKQPNGCSACLNNTISRLKKEARLNGI